MSREPGGLCQPPTLRNAHILGLRLQELAEPEPGQLRLSADEMRIGLVFLQAWHPDTFERFLRDVSDKRNGVDRLPGGAG